LPVSFAVILFGISAWILIVYGGLVVQRPTDSIAVALEWAASVVGRYAVSFSTVGFFFGWVESVRHTAIEKGED